MSAPLLIFLAGPNGAGKSTFCQAYLRGTGLMFVNADEITRKLGIPNPEAARAADAVRTELLKNKMSFITETVFSDPHGVKLQFLRDAIAAGYEVRLLYIGLSGAALSEARVVSRVQNGGHDVPSDRLPRRYQQSLQNLKAALSFVPEVQVYDNSSNREPFRQVLHLKNGQPVSVAAPLPGWLADALR